MLLPFSMTYRKMMRPAVSHWLMFETALTMVGWLLLSFSSALAGVEDDSQGTAGSRGGSPVAGPPVVPAGFAANPKPLPVHWPGEGGKKVDVSMGMVVVDFARINLREESFDMAGYLDTSWIDPSLAVPSEDRPSSPGIRRFRPGQIWAPALEFVNAVEQVNAEREGDLYVDDNGRVTQRVRFSHKFQTSLQLTSFPFDEQTLTIVVAPFDPTARDLVFNADAQRTRKLEEASVPDWTIEAIDAKVVRGSGSDKGDDPADGRFLFDVKVRRKATFYVWRVLVPLTLLVCASWTVFWFELKNLQPQISTCLAILLSFVTFNYAIDFSLPKVAYLTFIDRYTLISFAFVLSLTFMVTALHVLMNSKGVEFATPWQKRGRWLVPLAYVLTIAVMSLATLGR